MNVRETFESKVSKALNKARDIAGDRTEQSLKDLNNAIQMARSGSKGSAINIAQMTAIVGQQSVEGKRIPFGFKYRTLPHFTKDDYSPEARGFVENSYLRGLTPPEFFFHAMAGREGLIDTAVKTAETGYIQRRLVKALEEVMAKYDGTVRNSLGDIVEFIYGEDGLDAVYIEGQKLDIINCSDKQLEKKFRVDVMDPKLSLSPDVLEQAHEIAGDVDVQRYLDEEWEAILADREFLRSGRVDDEEQFQLPLNILRMIESAKTKFRIKDGARSDLHPADVVPKVRSMLDNLVVVRGDDTLSREAQRNATYLIKALLRSKLAFKRLVQEYSLNRLALDNILGDIENRFARALVSPGEMVGVLAAQSIGEPATQMTLNTFHFTGISSKNVTLGVPRLKEILNVATNIKTPSMTVYQTAENRLDQQSAKTLRSMVEYTSLKSVTTETEIWYDPDVRSTVIEADQDMVESYFIIPEEDAENPENYSRWLLRIILGRRQLLDKGLTVSDVAATIKREYKSEMSIIFSDDNADEQVIRIRPALSVMEDKDGEEAEGLEPDLVLQRLQDHLLQNTTLRGVPGISRAFVNYKERLRTKEDGSLTMSKSDPLCKEWFLDTSGTSLKDVLTVDGVDPHRTYSNHFIEVFSVFGIEATRSALMRELKQVLSFDGSYVNHRHLALLVDVMTARGNLMAVTRHGINRADTGALMRCSFEETVEILFDAASSGELDDCRGVSENIILGQLAPSGTGEFDILLDQGMLSTVVSRHHGMGAGTQAGAGSLEGSMTPYDMGSPLAEGGYAGGPDYGASFSPIIQAGGDETGGFSTYGGGMGGLSPYSSGGTSPGYAPSSPFSGGASPSSPGYSPSSPGYSPTSPRGGLTSPGYSGALSPRLASPASPAYNPSSPAYSPSSPAYGKNSISPTSPSYSPSSPNYSPTSPNYSPSSPNFSPSSPAATSRNAVARNYSPTSPSYSPTSPAYSPTSPNYSPSSPNFTGAGANSQSPTSPGYSPSSPVYSPTSPKQGGSDSYSPTSPKFTPNSPGQASPNWSPSSPKYSPR